MKLLLLLLLLLLLCKHFVVFNDPVQTKIKKVCESEHLWYFLRVTVLR